MANCHGELPSPRSYHAASSIPSNWGDSRILIAIHGGEALQNDQASGTSNEFQLEMNAQTNEFYFSKSEKVQGTKSKEAFRKQSRGPLDGVCPHDGLLLAPPQQLAKVISITHDDILELIL